MLCIDFGMAKGAGKDRFVGDRALLCSNLGEKILWAGGGTTAGTPGRKEGSQGVRRDCSTLVTCFFERGQGGGADGGRVEIEASRLADKAGGGPDPCQHAREVTTGFSTLCVAKHGARPRPSANEIPLAAGSFFLGCIPGPFSPIPAACFAARGP